MTQEENLLLKDLCSRLPYGVIVKTPKGDGYLNEVSLTIFGHKLGVNIEDTKRTHFKLDECRPYLRSLDSITDEEQNELDYLRFRHDDEGWLEFVLSKHLDWRDLISKNFALEAPNGMYHV